VPPRQTFRGCRTVSYGVAVTTFVPGLVLCEAFYREAVVPLLHGLPHAAARIGPGSEVLGFDTPRSVDHEWGPRLELFLSPADVAAHGPALSARLSERLPRRFRGFPTHFAPVDARIRVMTPTDGPVAHRIGITDVSAWSREYLGFDATERVTTEDWLATPTQRLAEATGGAVWHDDHGALGALRERLRWYPDDVWRHVLAAQWIRISQVEAFVGRTAEAGDDLGSRVLTAGVARDVMRLCLLLARRYPPYGKWLGTAFARVAEAAAIGEALARALDARDPVARQDALCDAYEAAVTWQNSLGLAPAVEPTRRPYFDRPFPVIDAGRVAAALSDAGPLGAVDQYVDSADVLCAPERTRALSAALRRAPGRSP
jgi:hypothetical protein